MTKQELAHLINDYKWGKTKKGLEEIVDYIFYSLTTKPALIQQNISDSYSAGARVYAFKYLVPGKKYFILNLYETPIGTFLCTFNSSGSSFSGNVANFTEAKNSQLIELHEEDIQLNKITIYEADLS